MSQNRHSRKFRVFTLNNTRTTENGDIFCTLCQEVIGHGLNAEDRFDSFFVHRHLHIDELNTFAETPKRKVCDEDHVDMILRHKGRHAIACRKCGEIIWKPAGWVDVAELDSFEAEAKAAAARAESCVSQHQTILALRTGGKPVMCGTCNRTWPA